MHADFLRIRMDQAIKVNVPLHFVNEEQCAGVKLGGGMIEADHRYRSAMFTERST